MEEQMPSYYYEREDCLGVCDYAEDEIELF